ncbi:MAG TPA: hypothetical protein DCZ18_00430, partial [Gammaproteobacteria bacterium]|nr:hypothetical protein [Gammaproteobacteria bacterium]
MAVCLLVASVSQITTYVTVGRSSLNSERGTQDEFWTRLRENDRLGRVSITVQWSSILTKALCWALISCVAGSSSL